MTEQELIRDIIQSIDMRIKCWEIVLTGELPIEDRYHISGRLNELKEVREFIYSNLE